MVGYADAKSDFSEHSGTCAKDAFAANSMLRVKKGDLWAPTGRLAVADG